MTIVWLSTSFGYYLILTLVNTFDNVYEVAITNNVSEILAYFLSGLFYERIGVKLSLILSFAISALGGVLLLVWGLEHDDTDLFFVFFLLAKFGVTCTFNINYSAP
jgi:Na+/melibiose symporter-like transporter